MCVKILSHHKCNILSAGTSAGSRSAQTGAPRACPQLSAVLLTSDPGVQTSAAPGQAQGLTVALGTAISEATAWDLSVRKGSALFRLPRHQEEIRS